MGVKMFLGYNYQIMKKRLLCAGWWLLGVALFVGAIVFVTYGEHNAAEKYKAGCEEQFARTSASPSKKDPSGTEECKDPKDYLPWWYILLSWPEGIAGWIVIGTGFAIVWQGWETRRAADATKGSVGAIEGQSALMKRQADAMEKQNKIAQDRERAILVVRGPDTPDMYPPMHILPNLITVVVRIFVANEGSSKAFNVRACGMLRIAPNLQGVHYQQGFEQEIPSIISPTVGEDFIRVTVTGMGPRTTDWVAINEATANNVRSGVEFLQISGAIVYDDLFGNHQQTLFRYIWRPFGNDSGGKWLDQSYWIDLGISDSEENQPDSHNPN
jgi:hypothetical protein